MLHEAKLASLTDLDSIFKLMQHMQLDNPGPSRSTNLAFGIICPNFFKTRRTGSFTWCRTRIVPSLTWSSALTIASNIEVKGRG